MALISTRDLSGLPGVTRLQELLQSMAMLDAILSPDWEYRYYSFNSHWSKGEAMGSMRNGEGDDLFALFNSHGCFLKGFSHESPAVGLIAPAEHYQGIPAEFALCVTEPAFTTDDVTFCIWRAANARKWSRNNISLPKSGDPDGSAGLLSPFDGDPETYQAWAEEYYELEVPISAVKAIYDRQPLTKALIAALNEDVRLKDLKDDIQEIGYPK